MSTTEQETIPCIFCGGPNEKARLEEVGYAHCKREECVGAWRSQQITTKGLRLVLLHKQGLQWVRDDEVMQTDVTREEHEVLGVQARQVHWRRGLLAGHRRPNLPYRRVQVGEGLMALADKVHPDEPRYSRLSLLLDALMECGLMSGNNPVIVQDEFGAEYVITEVTNETGDIGIIIEPKYRDNYGLGGNPE